jgi:cyanate lyase
MALPGQRGATNARNLAEVEALHAQIVHLKLSNPEMTWKEIGTITGYHWKYCEIVYRRERSKSTSGKLVEHHLLEVLEELELLGDTLRPYATGVGPRKNSVPEKYWLDLLLKSLDRKARWSGASRLVQHQLSKHGDSAVPKGSRPVTARAQEVEAKHRRIVELRLANPDMTWKEIAQITGFHSNYCSLVFSKAKTEIATSGELEVRRQQLLDEVELVADALRSPPNHFIPHKDHVNGYLKILDRKARLLGIESCLPRPEDESKAEPEDECRGEDDLPESAQRWLTLSRLFNGGLIEQAPGGLRISRKGVEAGLRFEGCWVYEWKDFGSLYGVEE